MKVSVGSTPGRLTAGVLTALGLIVGYAGLFVGGYFAGDEDAVIVASWASGNAATSGWRADIGVGLPTFVADPGAGHVWALLSLLERLFGQAAWVYPASILVLLWLTGLALFLLLRQAAPKLGWSLICLALLAVFSPLQHEFFFQRHWITLSLAAPLSFLLLERQLSAPTPSGVFELTLLSFVVFAFGSLAPTMHFGAATVLFLVCYLSYYRHRFSPRLVTLRFGVTWLLAILMLVLLMAWAFYSIELELSTVAYARDRIRVSGIFGSLNVMTVVLELFQFLHVGWLPPGANAEGFGALLAISWENVSPIFPIVFLTLLFSKSESFWEYACKFMLVGFLCWKVLSFVVPGITTGITQYFYPLSKFQPFMIPLEVVLLAILLQRLGGGTALAQGNIERRLRTILGAGLTLFYSGLGVFSVAVLIAPSFVSTALTEAIDSMTAGLTTGPQRDVLVLMTAANIRLLAETWGGFAVAFYFSSALLTLLFTMARPLEQVARRAPMVIPMLLLANNFLMSWALYPLQYKPEIWKEALAADPGFAASLKPTDRFYQVDLPSPEPRTYEYYRDRYVEGPFGPTRFRVGYYHSPSLDFSAVRSLTQTAVGDFYLTLARSDGAAQVSSVRDFTTGPLFASTLFDVAAVTYFYADRPLPEKDYLTPALKRPGLFVYRYNRAWPYTYLATSIETLATTADLDNKPFGPAYVSASDAEHLPPAITSDRASHAELTDFHFDRMTFSYAASRPSLLVVADAWHPQWRARFGDRNVPIIQANGIFKGIVLPAGEGTVELWFDNLPYKSGIPISVAAWVIFLIGWVTVRKKAARNPLQVR